MEENLISIIIPVHNAEKYIKETIESVKCQTYKNWEAIFIDDNSTDNSKKIIEENWQENMILIKLENNRGSANARNIGLDCAKGKYITFLDADDLWLPDKLKKQYEFMKKRQCAFSYTGFNYLKAGDKKSKEVKIPKKLKYKKALRQTRILPTTAMFNIDKIDKDLLKMRNVHLVEDMDTWWRILEKGYIAYGIREPLALYRVGHSTKSSNKFKMLYARWDLYRKIKGFSTVKSLYYFMFYVCDAIIKRI